MHYDIIGEKGGKGVWKLAEVGQIQWIKRRMICHLLSSTHQLFLEEIIFDIRKS